MKRSKRSIYIIIIYVAFTILTISSCISTPLYSTQNSYNTQSEYIKQNEEALAQQQKNQEIALANQANSDILIADYIKQQEALMLSNPTMAKYMAQQEEGRKIKVARETAAETNTIDGWIAFHNEFKNTSWTSYLSDAKDKIEQLLYKKATQINTLEAYAAYLNFDLPEIEIKKTNQKKIETYIKIKDLINQIVSKQIPLHLVNSSILSFENQNHYNYDSTENIPIILEYDQIKANYSKQSDESYDDFLRTATREQLVDLLELTVDDYRRRIFYRLEALDKELAIRDTEKKLAEWKNSTKYKQIYSIAPERFWKSSILLRQGILDLHNSTLEQLIIQPAAEHTRFSFNTTNKTLEVLNSSKNVRIVFNFLEVDPNTIFLESIDLKTAQGGQKITDFGEKVIFFAFYEDLIN